jgi:hypothetical protein
MPVLEDALDIDKVEFERPFLYPKQFDALFDPRRYSITEASTKSGKTSAGIVWLIEQAIQGQDGWNYWWVAPVKGQADIAFRRALRALPKDMANPHLTLKTITLINGAVMWFKSGDDPDNLYGEDVYAAVIDEASRLKEDAYYAVRSTLTATRGPIRLIGNVKGKKNFFYQMARKAQQGDPDMGYHKLVASDAVDAGVLEASEVDDARKHLPERVFRELYLAEASDDEGNPFGIQAIARCVKTLSTKPARVWGWDLAKYVDWTVGIALDENGDTCDFERFQMPWDATMERIHGKTGSTPALVDSTGVGDPVLELLQKKPGSKYEGYKFTSESKQKLMEGLAVSIQRQSIGYPDGPIRMELENFEYNYSRAGVRYCLAPSTPILTSSLEWKPVGDLKTGSELIAFDEFPSSLPLRGRRWRSSFITQTEIIKRPCYRLITNDGTDIICSAEHLWLVDLGRSGLKWLRTDSLRSKHPTSFSKRFAPHRLQRLLDVWPTSQSRSAGYLSAAFDGEGTLSQVKKSDNNGHGARLTFSQRDNEMAKEVRSALIEFGFKWSENHGNGSNGDVLAFGLTGRRHEFLRFLGQIRPHRLLPKFDCDKLGILTKKEDVTLSSIEFIGEREVVALGTTTKTLIASGLASHNSAPEGFHDDCVCALALANMHKGHARAPMQISSDVLRRAAQGGRR